MDVAVPGWCAHVLKQRFAPLCTPKRTEDTTDEYPIGRTSCLVLNFSTCVSRVTFEIQTWHKRNLQSIKHLDFLIDSIRFAWHYPCRRTRPQAKYRSRVNLLSRWVVALGTNQLKSAPNCMWGTYHPQGRKSCLVLIFQPLSPVSICDTKIKRQAIR
jgi:hypothetical protein